MNLILLVITVINIYNNIISFVFQKAKVFICILLRLKYQKLKHCVSTVPVSRCANLYCHLIRFVKLYAFCSVKKSVKMSSLQLANCPFQLINKETVANVITIECKTALSVLDNCEKTVYCVECQCSGSNEESIVVLQCTHSDGEEDAIERIQQEEEESSYKVRTSLLIYCRISVI